MKRKRSISIVLLSAFLMAGSGVFAQKQEKQQSVEKQRKEFLELQDERKQESAKKMEADREKHLKIQTKETRKRMKKNKKKMRRLKNDKHQDSFLKRLFTKKPH